MQARDRVRQLLERMENLLEAELEEEKRRRHTAVLDCAQPVPPVRVLFPLDEEPYTIAEIHEDPDKMLFNELLPMYNALLCGDDSLLNVRANYGVGTFVSLYGYGQSILGNNMPWVQHGTLAEAERRVFDSPREDTLLGKIVSLQEFYRERLSEFPKCAREIAVYHCDLQGPLDSLHLALGSEFYLLLYDEEARILRLMEQMSEDYVSALEYVRRNTTDDASDGNLVHWSALYRGKALLRNDSATNLSPEFYRSFSLPFEAEIVRRLGGASLHYCGKRVPWLDDAIGIQGLGALNVGAVPGWDYDLVYLEEWTGRLKDRGMSLIYLQMDENRVFCEDFKRISRKNANFSIVLQAKSAADTGSITERYRAFFAEKDN